MKNALIVAGAPWRWLPGFVELVRAAPLVLAADGGANHLARIGMRPQAVVGDLDSILPSVRGWVGEERMIARPDQDHTDLAKTFAYALDELGADSLTVLAATGGRLDHAVENLALLGRFASRCTLEVVDESARIVPVSGTAAFETTSGQTVSLLPLGRCRAVETHGLRWPLRGEPLDLLSRTSVSNVAESRRVEVAVEGGVLLVFLHHPTPSAFAW